MTCWIVAFYTTKAEDISLSVPVIYSAIHAFRGCLSRHSCHLSPCSIILAASVTSSNCCMTIQNLFCRTSIVGLWWKFTLVVDLIKYGADMFHKHGLMMSLASPFVRVVLCGG